MKKYFVPLIAVVITMTLASCDWDPTGHGTGGGGNGGGGRDTIVDFDSTDREVMILDMRIDESVDLDDSNIIQLVSAASPDDSGSNYTVVLNISNDKGLSFKEIVLTPNTPTYADNEINISVLIASPRVGATLRILI